MILIAEKETVYRDFPTPLINRLEKHYLVTSTILTSAQKRIMKKLIQWAKDFATLTEITERLVWLYIKILCVYAVYTYLIQNSKAVKKVCNSWESHDEKRF